MSSPFSLRARKSVALLAIVVVGALVIFAAFRPVRPVIAPGGSYQGILPGYGEVQLDLFLGGPWERGWLYREGVGLPDRLPLLPGADGGFRTEILTRIEGQWVTNSFLELTLADEGHAVIGAIRSMTNTGTRSFQLARVTEFRVLHASSGAALGRRSTEKRFHGWYPSFKNSAPLLAAVNERLADESHRAAREFLDGSLRHAWDASRLGWPVPMGGWQDIEHSQTRLVSGAICSVAVWSNPWTGGNGNSTRWAGRNFWWHDGKLEPFELERLFDPQTAWQTELRRLCRDEILRQGYNLADAVLSEKIALGTFTLSKTGLQIYFNPYVMTSGADGELVVHLTYSEIRPLLRRDGPAAELPASRAR